VEISKAKPLFESLYASLRGYDLSHAFRARLAKKDKSLVYGEVLPESFQAVMQAARPGPGEVFYDLGSGLGKAVVLANLLFDFSKCVGIEFVPSLAQAAQAVIDSRAARKALRGTVELINASFLDADFSDADVVFTHSACFSKKLMVQLRRRCEAQLKPGARIITISTHLNSPLFKRRALMSCRMDWGPSFAQISERIDAPASRSRADRK